MTQTPVTDPSSPKVAVIGAGSSGLPCIKALAEAGLTVEAFEAGSRIGGNWCIRNDNGQSSAYDSLHINTSRPRMQYADFPMPADYPDFPGHAAIQAYFEDYARHFGLERHIRFRTRIESAERGDDGRWRLHAEGATHGPYDALLVANGHHWDPRWPDPPYPGQFGGDTLHAHHYRNPGEPLDMSGRRVLVVGLGNSAMDIASELARPGLTRSVTLSSRGSAWVIPKYLFGRPLDQGLALPFWIPWRLRSGLMQALLVLFAGRPDRYGLPRPDHPLLSAHPTVSQEILGRFGSGDLDWRPDIARLDGQTVEFVDGSQGQFDVIVYCTGYNVRFPFLADDLLPVQDNRTDLWLRLMRPDLPNLFFIGLMQPLGAIMPLAEAQAHLVAAHLSGRCTLPTPSAMRRQMARDDRRRRRRYRERARHTMQVDFDEYLWRIRRVRRQGRIRGGGSDGHPFWSRMEDQIPTDETPHDPIGNRTGT